MHRAVSVKLFLRLLHKLSMDQHCLLSIIGPHLGIYRNEIYTQKRSHTEGLTHRGLYGAQEPLHRAALAHRSFYTRKLLQNNRQKFLPRETFCTPNFTHRNFYTRTRLDRGVFTNGRIYTPKLLHTEDFTQRSFYTEKPSHRGAFTQRSFTH